MFFSEIFQRVKPNLELGHTLNAYIHYHIDPQTIDEQLAQIISENPIYWHYFERVLKSKRGQMSSKLIEEDEDDTSLENPIRYLAFFGKKGSRNFLCALRKQKLMGTGWPIKENDEFNVNLEEMLPKSMELEEYFETHEIARPRIAFLGGLLFDYFDIALKLNNWAVGPVSETFEKEWKNHIRMARAAYELTRSIPEFKFRDYVFPASLALGIGKIMLHVMHGIKTPTESFATFEEKRSFLTSQIPELALSLERETFGVSHNEIAGLVLKYFEPTRKLEKGVWHYWEPYFLEKSEVHHFRLAMSLHFAQMICHRPEKFELTEIEKQFLLHLRLPEEKFWEAQKLIFKLHPKEGGDR